MIFSVTGPESSGKTTICRHIHLSTNWLWIPEYSRNYLARPPVGSIEDIILRIAATQSRIESLICYQETPTMTDTDAYTLAIWWQDKIRKPLPSPLIEWLEVAKERYRHVFLCLPDMPWEADPLREDMHRREVVFSQYERLLDECQIAYTILSGPNDLRTETAKTIIEELAGSNGSPGQYA